MTPARAPWSEVWTLFLENRSVFTKVFASLRQRGFVLDEDTQSDLTHEFLMERAPAALATFNPALGERAGWLFVVFRRFVVGAARTRARRQRLLASLAEEETDVAPAEDELRLDLGALQHALAELSAEERQVIEHVTAANGTVRSAARALGWSRWRTTHVLAAALQKLTGQLAAPAKTMAHVAAGNTATRRREKNHDT